MHARLAAFENRDMSRADELVGMVRDRQSAGKELPDALGMYMLVDRAGGSALGLSLFESEDAIRAAEPVFERMGDDIPEKLRGKRTSVTIYEVPIHEVADGATGARVSTFAGNVATMEDDLRLAAEEVLPDLRTMEGSMGMILLVDRDAGQSRAITLWESAEALAAGERHADEMRKRFAERSGQEIVSVERYDVAFAFDRAPRLVGAR